MKQVVCLKNSVDTTSLRLSQSLEKKNRDSEEEFNLIEVNWSQRWSGICVWEREWSKEKEQKTI